ncbi:uncharacterized protein LOC110989417 [Acanthaster planci]|uniref:Uncharacterized protein LOC110989417 n=1 Tax=Acanthaster planci TaxID=133434 RepID=A0A8B7ZXJ9_ACAPL|nr:uncharacterized protein LOC110989417 [Acanthaster planci]
MTGVVLVLLLVNVAGFTVKGKDDFETYQVSPASRHLMEAEDESGTGGNNMPVPQLDFWVSGKTTPHNIDGGSVLMYNWLLNHRVQPEHTAINVTFEVDFPLLTFHEDSVNITLASHTFGINGTEIHPIDVTWLENEGKVQLTVDIAEPLWINLTKPWSLPDCWWTPGKQCYQTTYEDCIFYDTSEEQNWDPAFCHQFNISQCLPHNTTSECFFLNPYECLTRLLAALAEPEDPQELLCPLQPNTTCIQINDRGLFFGQYDWTVPTKAPIVASFNKELCGMSMQEIFVYEEDHNGTVYIVDEFISHDTERDCRTVFMKLKPGPPTAKPTYNPYKDLPTTTEYLDAKDCINVNTTGFYYPPPDPIHWQDFNLTVFLTGELSNFVEVNQRFEPLVIANISQSTRPPADQLTSVTATEDYTVKKPSVKLHPYSSFSEEKHVLKHEQIFYELILRHPEARNHGIQLTVSFPAADNQVRMAFINETPWWEIGANLVATTHGAMFNETSDEAGHHVTIDTVQRVIADHTIPSITAAFSATDQALGILDQLTFLIDPFINLQDQQNNAKDLIKFWFYSRALTDVLPDQELSIAAKASYKYSRSDFFTSDTPKLKVTVQPFIPLIPAANPSQSPDTADLVRYTFDLSHVLDFYILDIWMNVSCPDLQIVPGTLDMEFLEPDMNTTTNSSTDLSFTSETTYYIHLSALAPEVNFKGNQTFLMWNNSMLTHQEIICNVMLSYRKGSAALILPYLAGRSPALTLPGIEYVLYPKDLVGQNDTMYKMPVGSNATYILNITFPETSTKTKTFTSSLTDWDIPARTTVNLDFGMVRNLADNKLDSGGDNLVLEFNVVLENTTNLVSRDTEHVLSTSVSYSNGKDLIQQETMRVLEPEVILILNMTNDTNAGDPGDVFQYGIHLSHTQASQSPAHHVVIELYLPYMAVYQDFIPSNGSHVPTTRIFEGLGQYEADGKLWLYLYKLPLEEFIEGTFLIQISTKLTEGTALLATSRYHMYSFYQWGRVYHFAGVSKNVINIRNATLIFDGTSHLQTPDNLVTIHEQVTYTMRVPVPPIPSNLSVALQLPRYPVTLKTWEVMKLKGEVPHPLPIEGTFLRQGCFPNDTATDACFCAEFPSGNGTFHIVYPDWLSNCAEIPKENCTGLDVERVILVGDARNQSIRNASCNGTTFNCTQCNYNNTGNCSHANETVDYNLVSTSTICVYHDWLYNSCIQSVLKECQMNSSIVDLWSHMFLRSPPNQGNRVNESLSNQTQAGNWNETWTTPTQQSQTNQIDSNQTSANHTTASPPYANQSQASNQTSASDDYSSGLSCTDLAEAFCAVATFYRCILPESVYNETGRDSRNVTCACGYYKLPPFIPTPQPTNDGHSVNDTNVTTTPDPYLACGSLNASVQVTTPLPDANDTTRAPSLPSVCDEEEEVYYGMASVVHTDIWSSREGAVCTFVGGNHHNPFNPGVYYISEYLPANLSEGGSTVLVTVTMVVLDLPELNRGDVLRLNATSTFSYVSYPIAPSDIFRENCTCRKPLEEHFDPSAPRECFCETWHLANMTDEQCNCTSYYVDEGDSYDGSLSCNCINFCWGILHYFLNPPHVAALQQFNTDNCDCTDLNSTLSSHGPESSLHRHVKKCMEPYKRNYSCHDLTYTVTHHEVSLKVSCACENASVESINKTLCSCNSSEILAKLQELFDSSVTVKQCMNSTTGFDEESFRLTFNPTDCSCQPMEATSTDPPHSTLNSSPQVNSTTGAYNTTKSQSNCSCKMMCGVHVEQDCIGVLAGRCTNITHTHSLPLPNSTCQCQKLYKHPYNISQVLEWYQLQNDSTSFEMVPASNNSTVFENATAGNGNNSLFLGNTTWLNNITSNGTFDTGVNFTDLLSSTYTYELECDCPDIDKVVYHVEPAKCVEIPAFEIYDCDCFVPPDNETQFILDNWDYNATIIDQMITRKSHDVIIVEPELQISFTRRPEPSIVDSIDPVIFDFEITHTTDSNAPAFNVTLQLDAVNFTRTTGFADLQFPSEEASCVGGATLCDVSYDNAIGRFHLPLLPIDPPGAVFKGTFNLSVGNHIDFVANSLITATGIAWYDSSLVDFPGRLYPSIIASDTVKIDAPIISAKLDFTTANSFMFLTSLFGEPPQTFSIGDYVRMEAKLWIPEITLQFVNFSMEAAMQNFTASSGRILLSDRVYHRNDTPSIYLEMEGDPDSSEGYLYPGKQYNTARFLDTGISVVPGVVVNEADNVANNEDFILLYFTFRVKDQPYWVEGREIPFRISATYVSDYTRTPVLLVDDSIVLTMVEPQLSLRVELLDHPWQLEQVKHHAGYTCTENTCCASGSGCSQGAACITATDDMQDCATAECHCYSGFTLNDEGGCTAVGRTAGDIINYGLTATHHVDFTGNAFDVFIVVSSELSSDLIPDAHFISHPSTTIPIYTDNVPSLRQLNDREFELYIKRFNHSQMCERFTVPHRIRPDVDVFPGKTWTNRVSMWYYSAKPYGTPIELNTESRFYRLKENITFNLTTPAPSARFYMLPFSPRGSSAIDFKVYSSSEWAHQVTVNLRKEGRVRFCLEVVVPKIKCNLTVLLALPEGDGFTFETVHITKMGSRIIFPAEKLSNESLTSDLHGNKFFYAELPDVYSQPYVIHKQREFNSTIQQQFKTMKGEQGAYPASPGCVAINTTLLEKTVLLGCFHDADHYFDVTMVTRDQPESVNFTEAMTRRLCQKLCRDADFLISATRNGTDCYCGNHTAYRQYADIAHSLYTPVNRTLLEPYIETIYFECNKTKKEWDNYTVTSTCLDQEVYETCVQDLNRSCENGTMRDCLDSLVVDCQNRAQLACNGSANTECHAPLVENCTNQGMLLCGELTTRHCRHLDEEPCLEQARESYYLATDFRSTNDGQACCVDAYVSICTIPYSESCWELVSYECTKYHYLEQHYNLSYSACLEADYQKCMEGPRLACASNGSHVCLNITGPFWNESARHCDYPIITLYNVTTANCTMEQLANCTFCLNEGLVGCQASAEGGSLEGCIGIAVDDCFDGCFNKNCHYELHEVLTKSRYSNCSQLEAESFDVIYLANCSQDITKWQNVTREIVDMEPVTLDFCNVTCSGDPNFTCGGEDFILIYGPLEGSLAQQQCDWYAGLYSDDEDVFSLEFELSITPLLTKGITEILQPFVSYDHGVDQKPTIIPFAPYRLEAGTIWLDMNVWIAPGTEGYVPGDLLEFYTEVFHHPLSTLTARDISVLWMFPTYVEYVNLTNHKTSLSDYNAIQPVEALRTDPTKGFQFYVPTLRNTDMISFHFLVRLDPLRALPQGEYHMVTLAETYYFSWDLYNPHEDDFKHNVLTHSHDVIPIKISFEVPTTYTGRPELEDLKLSSYNALYDEVHDIMYACFYNNTKHVYEGGCFMTGNLPPYKVEVPPTCEDYCNCTYFWDLPSGANCSEFQPKPENCSCGCLPDCFEEESACRDSCQNCTWCSYEELQVCLTECSNEHTNCSQECCLDACDFQLDACLVLCSNCSVEGDAHHNCSVDSNCRLDCSLGHALCTVDCLKPPLTCHDNCTAGRSECWGICEEVCQGQLEVFYPGMELNCSLICDWDCAREEHFCTKSCCLDECQFNHTICGDNCMYTCKDDKDCVAECLGMCSINIGICNITCDPPSISCTQPCESELLMCMDSCNHTCVAETCEVITSASNCSAAAQTSGNVTSSDSPSSCSIGNCTHHNETSSSMLNCKNNTIEHCFTSIDQSCFGTCTEICGSNYDSCDQKCCLLACPTQRVVCIDNCSDACGMDEQCLQGCSYDCVDAFDRCMLGCIMPRPDCRLGCEAQYLACDDACQPCGGYIFDAVTPTQSSDDHPSSEAGVIGNHTDSAMQTLVPINGTSCLNESGTCNHTADNSSCIGRSLNCTGSTTTSFPLSSAMPLVNCTVEIASCHSDCSEMLTDCVDQCPCDESCFRQYSTCWTTCQGCEPACMDLCHSNCSAESGRCIKNCTQPTIDPIRCCAEECNVKFDKCVPGCLYNLTVNITRFQNMSEGGPANISMYKIVTFLNDTCLDGCTAANKDCLKPCVELLSERNCTEHCFPGGSFSDFCSSQCHNFAYVYSNATLNRTFESCYQECLAGCTNWTRNSSNINDTSSTPTEGPSTNLSSSSNPEATTSSSSTYQTHSGNGTSPSGTASPTASSTARTHCIKDCRPVFPDFFNNCFQDCGTEFGKCTRQCVTQTSSETLNQSLGCTEVCGRDYKACSLDCTSNLVLQNCSLPCQDANITCLEGCRTCLECRDDCHWDCNRQKSSCLGVCFPPTCQDLHLTCLLNCSLCDCTGECRANCSSSTQDCQTNCLPEEAKSCQTDFAVCLEEYSGSPQVASNCSTGCCLNCSLSYAHCIESSFDTGIILQNCSLDDCSFSHYSAFLTNSSSEFYMCNSTSEDANNHTAVLCSNSTSQTSSCNGLCMAYQAFSHCKSLCNASMHSCLNTCQVCQDEKSCCAACAKECISGHYACYADCHSTAFPTNCSRNCSSINTSCYYDCINCTTCPECALNCEADYINCTTLSRANPLPTLANTTARNGSGVHPNCTAHYNCHSLCINKNFSEVCKSSWNCSDSNCIQQCLQEFISPACTSIDNCTEYSNFCGSHRRKRRSVLGISLMKSDFSSEPLKMPNFDDFIVHEEMKKRFLKKHLGQSQTAKRVKEYYSSKGNQRSAKAGFKAGLRETPFSAERQMADASSILPPFLEMLSNPVLAANTEMSHMVAPPYPFWLFSGGNQAIHYSVKSARPGDSTYDQALLLMKWRLASKPHHSVNRRSVDSPAENEIFFDPNATNSQFNNRMLHVGVLNYRYPVCSSNVLYLHYQSCLHNCSLLKDVCRVQCANFSAFCNGFDGSTSNCTSVDSSSLDCACFNETLHNVGYCVECCSEFCQGMCEELRPVAHKKCYEDCNETMMSCSQRNNTCDFSSNSSESGGNPGDGNASVSNMTCPASTNRSCDSSCFDPCTLSQHANLTACQHHCNQLSTFTDCLQVCNNSTCAENTTCNCTCHCSSFPEILTNHNCSFLEWANGVQPCIVKKVTEVCSCACGCTEIPRSYATTKWRALHSNVGNLLGLDPSSNSLYALSYHGLAILRSHDYGESWVAMATDAWHAARDMGTFVASTNLVGDVLIEMEPKELTFASGYWNTTWGVSGVGVHRFDNSTAEWKVLGTWQCCKDPSLK